MENEERKIIKRLPLPVMEVSEDGLEDVQISPANSMVRASVVDSNAKSLNFTAAQINNKLAHTESYAVANFTSASYVMLAMFGTSDTAETRIEGTYLITLYSNSNSNTPLAGPAIVNFKIRVVNNTYKSAELSCISGKLDTSMIELCIARHNSAWNRYAIFARAGENFRGQVYFKELSLYTSNANVWLYINDAEYQALSAWKIIKYPVYKNVASQINGITTWTMKIQSLPTSDDDLFLSLFGEENKGPDNVTELFDLVQAGSAISVVLVMEQDDSCTTIWTNSKVFLPNRSNEIGLELHFLYGMTAYYIEFALGDDCLPVPGTDGFIIKAL